MTIYYANEFVFMLPDVLKDKSVNMFTLTDEGPSDFGVVIARDKLLEGENLLAYVGRQIKLLNERMSQFSLLRQVELSVDEQRALQMDYTWFAQGAKMHQRQVILVVKKTALLITATMRDNISGKWESLFKDMIASIRLRAN